ncbi:hypothetical protein PG997_000456 [Apiospora hydei]|uniref:Uncharacterized protein n=1 Tax=Apiospora hydei TaxID=1337664 RepID=A0ABR1XAN1_9PEZI
MIASQDPAAKALMRQVDLPAHGAIPAESRKRRHCFPLRRLVLMGQDTPENLALFFGKAKSARVVTGPQRTYRLEALFGGAPTGSLGHRINMSGGLDLMGPSWTPRPASATETWELQEIRAIQEALRNDERILFPRMAIDGDIDSFLEERYGIEKLDKMMTLYFYAYELMV